MPRPSVYVGKSHLCTRLPRARFLLGLFCEASIKVQVAQAAGRKANKHDGVVKIKEGKRSLNNSSLSVSPSLSLRVAPLIAVITHPLFFDAVEK